MNSSIQKILSITSANLQRMKKDYEKESSLPVKENNRSKPLEECKDMFFTTDANDVDSTMDTNEDNDIDYKNDQFLSVPGCIMTSDMKSSMLCDEADKLAEFEKHELALQLWSKALSVNPPKPLKALLFERCAQIFLETENYFKAVLCASKALILDENQSSFYHLTMARALFCYGELSKSIKCFKAGLDMSTKELECKYNHSATEEQIETHDDLARGLNFAKKVKRIITSTKKKNLSQNQLKAKVFNNRVVGLFPFYETALPVDHSKDPLYDKYKYKYEKIDNDLN